ncbi:SIAH1 [Branchiostoma lanceolatum]|uniref:SIAH1 protein n=1 Tax=Branchiostoma lanceolatum TaxID=7740 RepID=A0A8J9W6F7_BRALA|nr:SIAH1 [Branchiostoma lanceolatum]
MTVEYRNSSTPGETGTVETGTVAHLGETGSDRYSSTPGETGTVEYRNSSTPGGNGYSRGRYSSTPGETAAPVHVERYGHMLVQQPACGHGGELAEHEANCVDRTEEGRPLSLPGYRQKPNDDEQLFAECPVCFDVVLPPIFQCTHGHVVCLGCLRRLTTCPMCRGPIGDARNLELERIANLTIHTCRYGWTRPMTLKDKVAHEKLCAW